MRTPEREDRLASVTISNSGVPAADVLSQLGRILASSPFRSSKRCSALLRHVVEQTCAGNVSQLKERTLGVAVFRREPDYDTNQDPVVRSTAGEIRKRLAQYYLDPGRAAELRIDLPPGAYVPEISLPSPGAPAEKPVVPRPARAWRWLAMALAVVTAGVLAVLLSRPGKDEFDQFWAPLVRHSGPVVFCIGQPHTYKLKGDLDRLFEDEAGSMKPASPGSIALSDLVPAYERHISLGDAQTATQLTLLMARMGRDVALLGGRTASLADLRGRPAILIGAFNNQWTLSLTGELRFYFEHDPLHSREVVRDRLNPGKSSWQVSTNLADQQVPTDYAIISRVLHPATEQPIVVAAGINRAGTSAAGEFLTNRAQLAAALRTLPAGWQQKNVQFVLATRLYAGNPGPASVVAVHSW